jgi:dihydrofolate synthase/folylpolyglutamate synthase
MRSRGRRRTANLNACGARDAHRVNYEEAIQFLYELRWFGAKLGLDNTRKLAELAGNPQNQLRFIHVAGTNGKGSTCAMLESIYREAGLKVGLFTSPHLVVFGERIQVNRQLISESEIVALVTELQKWLRAGWPPVNETNHPTFFEAVTVMALKHFAANKCDLVIWETGLGGRLDATNIVTPLASVITNVQFDHQKWLGNTLEEISFEKAGIIKPRIPILTAADEPAVLGVVKAKARAEKAPLTVVGMSALEQPPLNSLALPLAGPHQLVNAALAVATVRALAGKIAVSEDCIVRGLREVRWPGRLQLITDPAGRRILVDGAHNLAGARALLGAVRNMFPSEVPALILGILEDKDFPLMCQELAPMARRIFLTPVQSERSASPELLLSACRVACPTAEIVPCSSLADALRKSSKESFVVLTGSLYLVGEALELLGAPQSRTTGERGLNEWKG